MDGLVGLKENQVVSINVSFVPDEWDGTPNWDKYFYDLFAHFWYRMFIKENRTGKEQDLKDLNFWPLLVVRYLVDNWLTIKKYVLVSLIVHIQEL